MGESSRQVEPPIVLPPLDVGVRETSQSYRRLRTTSDWLDRVLTSEGYGAPRVFDLFTLLAVTLAFALLFGSLQLLKPMLMGGEELLSIVIGVFVTGIAIFQMLLWGGKQPRAASLVAGPLLWFLISVVYGIVESKGEFSWLHLLMPLCSSVMGLLAGYLGGALVAGVFLIADFLRTRDGSQASVLPEADNDDAIFTKDPTESD